MASGTGQALEACSTTMTTTISNCETEIGKIGRWELNAGL